MTPPKLNEQGFFLSCQSTDYDGDSLTFFHLQKMNSDRTAHIVAIVYEYGMKPVFESQVNTGSRCSCVCLSEVTLIDTASLQTAHFQCFGKAAPASRGSGK